VDVLAYHGQLTALAEASHIAWPLIDSSDNILWGQSKYADWGINCILFEKLEISREIDGHDAQLTEQIRYYSKDLEVDRLNRHLKFISGHGDRTWSMSDFQKQDQHGKKGAKKSTTLQHPVDWKAMLSDLANEFVAHAHYQEGVPYTKLLLARNGIVEYIILRDLGKLEKRQSMVDAMMHPDRKPVAKAKIPDHLLCPDRETFDRFLGDKLNFMSLRHYDAATTFELVPSWLRFLESRGLVDTKQSETAVNDLRGLQEDLLTLFDSDPSDPAVAENIRAWPDMAMKVTTPD
jgi:hypothetical protein